MILKRVGSIKNKKNKKCLQCGRLMVGLKDNEVHRCGACGQKHYVDIYGTTLVLTVAERKDLRHRTEPKSQDDPEVVQKKKDQDDLKSAWLNLEVSGEGTTTSVRTENIFIHNGCIDVVRNHRSKH